MEVNTKEEFVAHLSVSFNPVTSSVVNLLLEEVVTVLNSHDLKVQLNVTSHKVMTNN